MFVLAWFVASAATVGGGLGSGFETNEAVRAATYSQREQERRDRLVGDDDRDQTAASRTRLMAYAPPRRVRHRRAVR